MGTTTKTIDLDALAADLKAAGYAPIIKTFAIASPELWLPSGLWASEAGEVGGGFSRSDIPAIRIIDSYITATHGTTVSEVVRDADAGERDLAARTKEGTNA